MMSRMGKGKIGILVVFTCAMLCTLISALPTVAARQYTIESFVPFQFQAEVPAGTDQKDVPLPTEIKAFVYVLDETSNESETHEDGASDATATIEERDVPVTWTCEGYNPDVSGEYFFTASVPTEYIFNGEFPVASIVVGAVQTLQVETTSATASNTESESDDSDAANDDAAETTNANEQDALDDAANLEKSEEEQAKTHAVQCFAGADRFGGSGVSLVQINIGKGVSETSLPLPSHLGVLLDGGVYQNVPVQWSCGDYNSNVAGTYRFEMSFVGDYTYSGALPYAQVSVKAGLDG